MAIEHLLEGFPFRSIPRELGLRDAC